MIKFFTKYLNRYKLHPVELKNNGVYQITFQSGAETFEVTKNISLIGLNKLTVAIFLPAYSPSGKKNFLCVFKNNMLSARLELKPVTIHSSKSESFIYFFEIVNAGINGRRLKKYTDIVFLYLKNVSNKKSKNFIVPAKTLFSLFGFCIKPRPVYVVCIGDLNAGDIFPIDITGNISENFYFFSVRKTSPAVQQIIEIKRVCLCLVPFNKKEEVYSLGKHHKDGKLDFSSVNFKFLPSSEFKIPVPDLVININELKIVNHFDCGVHTVFYSQSVEFSKFSNEFPLAHTPWYNL
jgi:flavin reductase (DIM6/NTAB) family NADH-FMN oxidoreductase RutF